MKKNTKTLFLSLSILFIFCFLLVLGVSFFMYKDIAEEQPNLNLTYLQTMTIMVTRSPEQDLKKQIKESYLQEDYQHISIYYEKDFTELLPLTKETLELAFEKTDALFGKTNQEPIDFLVFQDGEEMSQLSGIEGGAGFYSEKDSVLAIHYYDKDLILKKEKYPLYIFQGNILHEYTHYAFARKAKEQGIYPLWFIEGIAVYVEDKGQGAPLSESVHIPFVQLTTYEQWDEARYIASTNHYAQSYFAIEYLIKEYGEGVISELMNTANETEDFRQSFKEVTGLTISELDRAYPKTYMK